MARKMAELIEPHPRMTPSEWAASYRVLTRGESARPGPWRNSATPYSVAIMDACGTPGVVEIVALKSSQAGISEAVRNALGWMAHLRPDPMLLVLPDEDVAKRIVKTRILPMFDSTSPLKRLHTNSAYDRTQSGVALSNGFSIRAAWSGSPASLASDPIRVVVCDEVDKYPPFSGREANPIDLATARTKTYGDDRLVVKLSTPTTREGAIWNAFVQCDVQLYYYVPCPDCGRFQQLVFDRVKWERGGFDDRDDIAKHIRLRKRVWYECQYCPARWTDAQKQEAVRHGKWASEAEAAGSQFDETCAELPMGAVVDVIGHGGAARVGFQLSDMLCEWVTFAELASEFVSGDTFMFVTNRLGRPHSTAKTKTLPAVFVAKASANTLPPDVVPEWATALIASVDVQRDCFYYVVRAWGAESRSHRVKHGILRTFDEVERLLLHGEFPVQHGSVPARCAAVGIDSGDGEMTPEVYRFARKDPRIMPMKGSSSRPKDGKRPIWESAITYQPKYGPPDPLPVMLRLFVPDHFKDLLSLWISKPGDPPHWTLSAVADDDYAKQMASEHKVVIRKGSARYETWVPVAEAKANHYWDCEVMNAALSTLINAHLFPPIPKEVRESQSKPIPQVDRPQAYRPSLINRRPIRTKY